MADEVTSSSEHDLEQLKPASSSFSTSPSSTIVASPLTPISPTIYRPGYQRVPSNAEQAPPGDEPLTKNAAGHHGLGLSFVDNTHKASGGSRGSANDLSPPPHSTDAFLSPPPSGRPNQYSYHHHSGASFREAQEGSGYHATDVELSQGFATHNEYEALNQKSPSAQNRDFECAAKKPLLVGRSHWLAVSVLLLSAYSTVLSGLWFVVACMRLPYGGTITASGPLSPKIASVVCSALAKTIELSFVTTFITFLGQLLSTRAIVQRKGITLAEMSMRSWVTQPGTMLTHMETIKYGGASWLGALALATAIVSMFYTTASSALVEPQLKLSETKSHTFYGKVATSFANSVYIQTACKTPIQEKDDPEAFGQTCIQIEHNAQAFNNYYQYMTNWTDRIDSGNGTASMASRPLPVALLHGNTTVSGSWIESRNMTESSADYDRLVNNVTMAMPHSGVFTAAKDDINDIVQPQDPSGLGEYTLQASVPSPVVNVLCADLTKGELTPFVYQLWDEELLTNGTEGSPPNATNWPNDFNLDMPSRYEETSVDDIFGFDTTEIHPIFPKLPLEYNTVLNTTDATKWGRKGIYLLFTTSSDTHTMCSIRAGLTPKCLTEYHSKMSDGHLQTRCEDEAGNRAYINSMPDAPVGVWDGDWPNIAGEWARSLSLNDGITDGKSANARLLTQLIPAKTPLDPSLPSVAEALAVLAGNTLLLSSMDAPFIHHWNYSKTVNTLNIPQYQAFEGTLRFRGYVSGGTTPWQKIFYLVLATVFLINIFTLAYFTQAGQLVTDFLEPQNLFSLSMNSPPSAVLDGHCAGGPGKEALDAGWRIILDRERDHLYFGNQEGVRRKGRARDQQLDYELPMSPLAKMYSQLGRKRSSML